LIRDGDRLDLVANDGECAAVAKRLGLDSIERLEAHATLERRGQIIRAQGRLLASLTQRCVVTGEAVPAHADEPFSLIFVPEPEAGADEEIELGEGDCDTVFHDGSVIDLGSAIADTLALSLDPYPRSAEADAALREAGVMREAEASPFAALAALDS
jgi:uncharacterized metal-binding protein YceD (DUF177 family)